MPAPPTLDPPPIRLAAPVNDGTRREFLLGGLSLGALLLAGCGDSDDGTPAASEEPGFPVTVTHKYGTTRIDARPKRVATLGAADHDPVLALGVTPVMVARTVSPTTFHAWNEDKVGSPRPAEHPATSRTYDAELVAAQRPDLILALQADLSRSDYEKLSKLAPTIAPDGRYKPFATPWESMTRTAGRALGRPRQADRLVADAERRIASTRRANPRLAGAKVLIATANSGNVGLNGPGITRYSVFKALGMAPTAPGLEPGSQDGRLLSLERLDQLNAVDVIVWIGPGSQKVILDVPTYRSQPIHRRGRDFFPPQKIAPGLAFPSVLSVPYAAAQLAPELSAAADGDPATKV